MSAYRGESLDEELAQSLVRAAQQYDYAGRPAGIVWQRVPDEQVRRLLAGALGELGRRGLTGQAADPDAFLGQGSGPVERRGR